MFVLVASVVAIFGLLPQAAHAIPPASLRIWFLQQQADLILGVNTYFNDPADKILFNQLRVDHLAEDFDRLEITIYDTARPVTSGQLVAVTSVVWLDERVGIPFPVTGTQFDAHKLLQNIPKNTSTGAVWSSRLVDEYHTISFDQPLPEFNNYLITGRLVVALSGRPHIIESVVYVAPEVTDPAGEFFEAKARYSYSADTTETASLLGPAALLKVISNVQKVEVRGGTVAVDQLNPDSNRLIPTSGQTVIAGNSTVACGWVVNEIRGDCITSNPITIGVYSGAQTTRTDSWSTLTRTMSKLAQERGEFTNAAGSALSTKINDFITAPLNIWESSRGKVLFVTTPGDLIIDPGVTMNLSGKKVIVFTEANSVSWQRNVVVDGSNAFSPHHKLAVIAFKDNAVIELTGDAYVGAYMSRGSVRFAGSGSTLNLHGLVIADDEFIVTRSVPTTAASVIARITYDPSFQNGTVVGLSPFVRPLVSGGSDR